MQITNEEHKQFNFLENLKKMWKYSSCGNLVLTNFHLNPGEKLVIDFWISGSIFRSNKLGLDSR